MRRSMATRISEEQINADLRFETSDRSTDDDFFGDVVHFVIFIRA